MMVVWITFVLVLKRGFGIVYHFAFEHCGSTVYCAVLLLCYTASGCYLWCLAWLQIYLFAYLLLKSMSLIYSCTHYPKARLIRSRWINITKSTFC
jgi:hypothetical protein